MADKKHRRFKHILFDEPKPYKEYLEFWRSPDPEKLARERGYTIDEKLKKFLDVMFISLWIGLPFIYEKLFAYL